MSHVTAVTAVPAAAPAEAARHFATRLALETDVADVAGALAAGEADFVVVDVRSREAYAAGHLPGALSLPHGEIDEDTAAALPDGLVVAYCWGQARGGFDGWVAEGHAVAREAAPQRA
jgi:3-mercaptopyruvate sulfurtransferase SseA